MIVGQWGVILNLLTIAVITMAVTVLAISLLLPFFENKQRLFSPASRKNILWFVVYSPWLIGVVTSLLFLATFSTLFQAELSSVPLLVLPHWHHPDTFEVASWHGVSIALFLIWAAIVAIKKFILLINTRQTQSSLKIFSKEQGKGSYLIDSELPNAFTCGFISPKSYVTTGLKAQLSKEELDIVLAHEAAHIKSFDPLKKWFFMLLAAFFPASISKRLNDVMSQTMEQLADNSVVGLGYQNDTVASTLVKVARISMRFQPNNTLLVANYFHAEALEARVKWLLNSNPTAVKFHYLVLALPCLLLLISMFSVDSLHHLIETILNY